MKLEFVYGILLLEFTIYICAAQVPFCYVTANCTGQSIRNLLSLTECCSNFGASVTYDSDRRCLPCPDMDCPRRLDRDVVFVIDTSVSLGSGFSSAGFQEVRELAESIAFNIKANFPKTLFGLITFDDIARVEFNISRYSDLSTLLPAINPGLPHHEVFTSNITSALSLLLSGSVPGGFLQLRNETSNVAIVITHHSHRDHFSLQLAASSLHEANIFDVYAVGIGNYNYSELQVIASGDSSFVSGTTYLDSQSAHYVVEDIIEQLCSIPTPDIQISVFGYETLGNETLRNVTIGDPLTLDCTVTAVRGISSSVDIIIGWSTRSRILRRINNVMGVVKDDSMIYTDSLEIPSLSAIDNGKDYLCTVLFNSSQVLAFNIDIFTLIFPAPVCFNNTDCRKESAIDDQMLSYEQCCFDLSGLAFASSGQCLLCPKTDCTIHGVTDVVFVIETSSNIGSYQFRMIRKLVDNITTNLKLNSPENSVGVILFDNTTHIQFNLEAHTSLSTLSPAINPGLPYNNGNGRDTAAALNLLLSSAQNGSLGIRNETSNIAIVVTTGRSDSNYSTQSAADALHAANIFDVYAIGYNFADINELNTIASDPNLVYFDRFRFGINIEELQMNVGDQLCSLPVPRISHQPSVLLHGSTGDIMCSVTITSAIDPKSVELTWTNADSIITADNRVTVTPTIITENPSSFTYTTTIQFASLTDGDKGNYTCNVTVDDMLKSQSTTSNLRITVPRPVVEVTSIGTVEFGKPVTLECNVIAVRGITSRVDIIWFNSTSERRTENVTANIVNNSAVYTDQLVTPPLSYIHRGTRYLCGVTIFRTPGGTSYGNISLNFAAPSCHVITNCIGEPINNSMIGFTDCCLNFGVSYNLDGRQCYSCPNTNCPNRDVRDVVFVIDTSRSIVSSRFQLVREVVENITVNLKINFHETLFGLITFDNFARYHFNISSHTDLNTLLPAINPGLPYNRGLKTNTADGLSLLLSGSVPDGFLQLRNESSKVAIVITDGISSSFSSLQSAANSLHAANIFDVYAVGIGNNNFSELQLIASGPSFVFQTSFLNSFTAQSLVEDVIEQLCSIPKPIVTIATSIEPLLGQSLTLECRIEAVKDIDSTFNIIWTTGNTEVRRVKNLSTSLISNYTDTYTIPVLRTSDAFTVYRCEVMINTSSPITANGFITLNVTQPPQIIVSPSQSPVRVTVGSHLLLVCTAVKGFPIPDVQWHSEDFPVYPLPQPYQQIYLVPTDFPHTTIYTCVGTTYSQGAVTNQLGINVTVIVEKPCRRLKAPRNGDVIITDDQQLAFFSCKRGFTMRGSHVSKCIKGKWNSSPPNCKSISQFCRRRCNF